MFEKATRLKLRFDSPQGLLTVEDLWDLPLTSKTGKANLDDIARGLHKEIKETEDAVSFVTPSDKSNELLLLEFEIVKHIIQVRVAERDADSVARANRERKQQILEIIAQKKNEALLGSSIEELENIVKGL